MVECTILLFDVWDIFWQNIRRSEMILPFFVCVTYG
ncbi:hypothetical protein MKMG_00278 [Methanogenium sp. MK-MG]|nr:hypothetical protein MKMG_00278 [Methanogenium sp. MK-MG]